MRLLKRNWSQVIGMLLVACVLPSCSDDKGMGPEKVQEYAVHFFSNEWETGNWYFRYVPSTNRLDSTYLEYGDRFVISADGEKMYIPDRINGGIAVLRLPGYEVMRHLPYTVTLAASPDNRYLAVTDTLSYILETENYTKIASDSLFQRGTFSADSRTLYGQSETNRIKRFHFATDPVGSTTITCPFGYLVDYAISPSEDWMYLYVIVQDYDWYFLAYNASTDSVASSIYFTPGYGDLSMSPDGKYVFLSNPGTLHGWPGETEIHVYDTNRQQFISTVTTRGPIGSPYEEGVPPWEMEVTPDGKWLVMIPAKSFSGVYTIDIDSLSLTHYRLTSQHWNEGLTCQNGL